MSDLVFSWVRANLLTIWKALTSSQILPLPDHQPSCTSPYSNSKEFKVMVIKETGRVPRIPLSFRELILFSKEGRNKEGQEENEMNVASQDTLLYSILWARKESSSDHLPSFLKDEMHEGSLERDNESLQHFMPQQLQRHGWGKKILRNLKKSRGKAIIAQIITE